MLCLCGAGALSPACLPHTEHSPTFARALRYCTGPSAPQKWPLSQCKAACARGLPAGSLQVAAIPISVVKVQEKDAAACRGWTNLYLFYCSSWLRQSMGCRA